MRPWDKGCCGTRGAPPAAGTESQSHNSWAGRDPRPSPKQVSPIHSSAGTSHRVRKQKQKGAERLSDPSSQRSERMFSTSLSKGHGQVQDSSPAFGNFSLQQKRFKSYWQTPGRTTEGYYAAFSLLPIALEESLGLKANHIITTSLCFKEGSELSRFVPDEVAKLLMQAQWNQAPIRCYSLAQLFVPAEEAINWWWIEARAREAMIYQHLQCQCSSTSWISTAKKNWPVRGSRVIFKNWRNRRPPRHLKKNTNYMKNLSIFPLEKSRRGLLNLSLHKFMTTHQRNAKEKKFSCSIFCFVSDHRKNNPFYTRLKGWYCSILTAPLLL